MYVTPEQHQRINDAVLMREIAFETVFGNLKRGEIEPPEAVHALRSAYRRADLYARGRAINTSEN